MPASREEQKAKRRKSYLKNKEKNREKYDPEKKKEYRKNNKEKIKESSRLYLLKQKEDPNYDIKMRKYRRIQQWKVKNQMIYWGTWEELGEIYDKTTHCCSCKCELSEDGGRYQKSLDHDHFSNYVRDIICKTCNNNRGKIDRNKMFLHLELYRYFKLT
tara:strand:+ start:50 stop:526 length:477 start_codon:yes stop_codon:yes gene_type:complete